MGAPVDDKLTQPTLPTELIEPLNHYFALSQGGDFSFLEIKSYCELMNVSINYLDVKLIKDIEYCNKLAQAGRNEQQIRGAFTWHN